MTKNNNEPEGIILYVDDLLFNTTNCLLLEKYDSSRAVTALTITILVPIFTQLCVIEYY